MDVSELVRVYCKECNSRLRLYKVLRYNAYPKSVIDFVVEPCQRCIDTAKEEIIQGP